MQIVKIADRDEKSKNTNEMAKFLANMALTQTPQTHNYSPGM
jgi:hypothetical protein